MNALLVGKRRMGKSTLALSLARVHSNIVIVYDPNTQYRDFGEPMTVEQINTAMMQFADENNEPPAEPVIMIFRPNPATLEEDFQALAEMLWQWDGYSFIVDEAAVLQSPHNITPTLARLVRQGPAGVSIFQTCHRVPDLNRLARALCTDYFFFRSNQQKDVANMATEFDDRLIRVLPSLRSYEVVHHWQGKGGSNELSIWRDSKPWFIEIGHGETESQFNGAADEADDVPQGDMMIDHSTVPYRDDKLYQQLKEG